MSEEFKVGDEVFYFGETDANIIADDENYIKDKEKYVEVLNKYKKILDLYDKLYIKKEKTSNDKLLLEKCYRCISNATRCHCKKSDLETLKSRHDFYYSRAQHEGLVFPHEYVEYNEIRNESIEREAQAKLGR